MTQPHILIGFATPMSPCAFIAFAIRLIEETPYSHTYIKIWSDSANDYIVYQENFAGLSVMNGSIFNAKEKIFSEYKIEVTEEQLFEIIRFCHKNFGLPYGTKQIMGMLWARSLRQLGCPNAKNPFADGPKTMVCSELVGTVLGMIGKQIDPELLEIEGPKLIHKKVVELYNTQRSKNV